MNAKLVAKEATSLVSEINDRKNGLKDTARKTRGIALAAILGTVEDLEARLAGQPVVQVAEPRVPGAREPEMLLFTEGNFYDDDRRATLYCHDGRIIDVYLERERNGMWLINERRSGERLPNGVGAKASEERHDTAWSALKRLKVKLETLVR